ADDQAERVAANHLANSVFADLAEVLDNPGAAHRLTRAWTTPAEGRQILTQVLEIHANTHLRTEIAVHQIEAELAAQPPGGTARACEQMRRTPRARGPT